MTADDEYLAERIKSALAVDPRINKQDVKILIRGTRVHLLGQTSTAERRRLIGEVASGMCPELEVCNELTVIEVTGPTDPETIHD